MTFTPLIPSDDLLSTTLNFLLPSAIPSTLNLASAISGPFTTDLYALLGIDATLFQPPVPGAEDDAFGAITEGGPGWKKVVPGQFTKMASLGIVDMDQSGGEGEEEGVIGVGDKFYRNFWPGLGRRNLGVRLEDAVITFGEGVDLPGVVVEV